MAIFLAVFFIAGTIAYYSVRMFTQSADEIVLPELTDKNIIWVLETLTNMGLNAKLYGTQYDDAIPRYSVISQDPKPGATIKKGRDVIIYLSKGKKENVIPDLRQIPLKQALILLEKNEFQKGQISFTYSSKTETESIIAQYPEPFSTALKGSACNLLVSRGIAPLEMVMPDMKGQRLETASSMIEKYHLTLSKISSDLDEKQNYGIVLAQMPEAGSYVTQASHIALVVNNSEKNKQMLPDKLTGLILITHTLYPGFLNQHVRVETDMFGPVFDLYNEYMKPGTDINLLIPSGIKTTITIFIDYTLEKIITIDPWKEDMTTGEHLWESSLPQFYQPISPDLAKN